MAPERIADLSPLNGYERTADLSPMSGQLTCPPTNDKFRPFDLSSIDSRERGQAYWGQVK